MNYNISMSQKRFILVDVVPPTITRQEGEENLHETISLIDTYGRGEIIKIIQRRAHPHPATYIGTGKTEEITQMVKELDIDAVIVNGIISTAQIFRLTKAFWTVNPLIEVWDRIDLILNIFQKHAHTAEAKLQIERARMEHMGPRMYGLSEQLGRQTGGIGARGIGETNVELMKRHWRDSLKQIDTKIKENERLRLTQIQKRAQSGCKTIAIVGYTNAGKTTLFNKLTKKDKRAEDRLFATLDNVTGKLYLPSTQKTVLLSDTIGFIQKLPPELISAFKSTLLASLHADILLHVVDASDAHIMQKIRTVDDILTDLKMESKPQILVLNKVDLLSEEEKKLLDARFEDRPHLFFSSHDTDKSALLTLLTSQIPT